MGILDGKVIIMTGASNGIGRACAIDAAKKGATVVLSARRQGPLEEVAESIRKDGGKAYIITCDVVKEEDIDRVVETTVQQFGRIDGLFNNAQAGLEDHINTPDEIDYEKAMRYYVGGPWASLLFTRKVAPHMARNGGGRIVNVSSHASLEGTPNQCGYAMAKGAVEALTKCTANYYGKDNIIINLIYPVAANPEFINGSDEGRRVAEKCAEVAVLGYLGMPDDIAPAVSYLLSDDCHYMTGQFLNLSGGMRTTW